MTTGTGPYGTVFLDAYDAVVATSAENTNASGTTTLTVTNSDGAGYLWVVTSICAWDTNSAVSSYVTLNANAKTLKVAKAPAALVEVRFDGTVIVPNGNTVTAVFADATSGDDVYLYVHGYRVRTTG